MKKFMLISLVFAIAGGLILSGYATPAQAEKTQWDKLVEAAKAEGTVTYYISWGQPAQKAINKGFYAKYGIVPEGIGGSPPALYTKIEEEQVAGVQVCDLYCGGAEQLSTFILKGYAQKPLLPLPALENRKVFRFDPYSVDPEGKRAIIILHPPSIPFLVNTNLVKEIPDSMYDLLDPWWKGKMVMTDPRVGGPGVPLMFVHMNLGEDYWRKFAKQEPLLERNHQRPIDAVALGEKAICIGYATSRALAAIEAGAPMDMAHPKEGSQSSHMTVAIPKGVKHPNAATLLINWILSKEGQTTICKGRKEPSFRYDIDPSNWLLLQASSWEAPYKVMQGAITSAENKAAKDFAIKIFGPVE